MAENNRERKQRNSEEARLDGLSAELERAETLLNRVDLIHLPLEVIEAALQRKVTIEWIFAERERRAVASVESGRQRSEAVEERKRVHEERMATDPAYRREVERRERADGLRKKLGQPPVSHGPLPRS
jgi:hypothetical protein